MTPKPSAAVIPQEMSVFPDMKREYDLIVGENGFPILSIFRSTMGDPYLRYSVGQKPGCNRFLVMRVTDHTLYQLVLGTLGFRELMLERVCDAHAFLLDEYMMGQAASELRLVSMSNLPPGLIPDHNKRTTKAIHYSWEDPEAP